MCCTVPAASQRRETKSESLVSKVSIDDVNTNLSALLHVFIIYTFSLFVLPVMFPQIPVAGLTPNRSNLGPVSEGTTGLRVSTVPPTKVL